ncbi:MAG: undecaprenyl/decaprenyl-phosphate alpha-N-acetylglucosaminyl 1-phosphate transferase [Deltaproteobacteria bacterium]|nr:undecaprenyl/decaprenyl-phosphate alpha-N-acetylglucosaminyl 1-phosphate transferase [Deltaproteobacteria bacterium]
MWTYLVAFLLAAAVGAAATPVVARMARRFGWLDAPGHRKVHTRAVPRLGGIAVVLAFFVPLIGLALYTNRVSDFLYRDANLVVGLSVGGIAIALLGVVDDLKNVPARTKLAVQILVAVGMWFAGFRIELFSVPVGEGVAELGRLSLPLTVLWFVGVINALNLIDGLDGLASGLALFAAVVLFTVSFQDHAVVLCLVSAALGGSLLGFLFFNFNPAKIFLGDSGSMFLGFALAAISVWTQRKGATVVALAVPVLALGVPILDVTLSVVRRVGRGRSPFTPDREHVHHRLLALGLSHRRAVVTLYGLGCVFGLGALALLRNDTTTRAIGLSAVGVAILLVVRKVGVVRFPSIFRRADGGPTGLRHDIRAAARRIRSAARPEDVWEHLKTILYRMGCDGARLAWMMAPGDSVDAAHGESVLLWSRDGEFAREPRYRSGTPTRALLQVSLDEDTLHLGSLEVLLARRELRGERVPEFRLALELLRDALTDFMVAYRDDLELEGGEDRARVFHLPAARGEPGAAVSARVNLEVPDVG